MSTRSLAVGITTGIVGFLAFVVPWGHPAVRIAPHRTR